MNESSDRNPEQKGIRHLLRRFPDHAHAIRELHSTDVGFRSLSDDYHTLSERLEGTGAQGTSEGAESARLRHQHAALEEELLGFIEGYGRV